MKLICEVNTGFRSLSQVSNLDSMRDPTASRVPDPIVLHRIKEVMASFRGIVEGMSIDAGISHLLGLQLYRFDLSLRPSPTTLASPLSWIKRVLPRKPLPVHPKYPPMKVEVPSLAWIFVGTIVLSETIEKAAGLKLGDIQDFTVWICHEFYNETAKLVKKMRNAKMDSVEKDWATLNENLTAIYLLTMYCSVRRKLQRRLGRSATDQRIVTVIQQIQKRAQGLTGDAIEDFTTSEDATKLMGYLRDRISFIDQHNAAMKEEAWDHLRDYTQHWLEKMGEGPGCFGRVMVNTFNLNTLCRLEESLVPPDTYRPSIQSVVEKAYTLYQTLDPVPEQQANMRHFANSILSAFEGSIAQIESADDLSLATVQFLYIMLDLVERQIASKRAERGPSEGKDRKIKAPEDFPEDSLGFLEPLVARGEGSQQGIMIRKVALLGSI